MTGTAGGIGGFLTSLLIGRIVESISFAPVFVVAGLIYPICVLVIFMSIKEIKPVEIESPS
jgi:nitrate/nitrite transporter NarK